jgi:hypothetical protein
MCLYIKKGQRAKTVKEDIECYKIVWLENGNYESYYRHARIELGKTYTSKIERYGESIEVALHSLASLKDAFKFVNERIYQPKSVKIVKCTIPQGSKYFQGYFDGEDDSYASDTITYTKEIIKYNKSILYNELYVKNHEQECNT